MIFIRQAVGTLAVTLCSAVLAAPVANAETGYVTVSRDCLMGEAVDINNSGRILVNQVSSSVSSTQNALCTRTPGAQISLGATGDPALADYRAVSVNGASIAVGWAIEYLPQQSNAVPIRWAADGAAAKLSIPVLRAGY